MPALVVWLLVLLAWATPVTAQIPQSPVLTAPPERMRQTLVDAYRLKPDARFLGAAGEVHRLFTGQARSVTATFDGARWTVGDRGGALGTVPEMADFPDALDLLVRQATALERERPLGLTAGGPLPPAIAQGLARFLASDLARAARLADAEWRAGRRHATLLVAATRALAGLAFQSVDRAQVADAVGAKALALLATARALTGQALAREEVLLAHALGYSTHAERVARGLAAEDPLRLYAEQDDVPLKTAAEDPRASVEARYLWLRRLADLHDSQRWIQWLRTGFAREAATLALLDTALRLNAFDFASPTARRVPGAVLREVAALGDKPEPSVATPPWLARFGRAAYGAARALDATNAWLRSALGRPPSESDALARTARWLRRSARRLDNDGIASLLEPVEAELIALRAAGAGPLVDGDTLAAWYHGALHSGLTVIGLHLLDALASLPAARDLAERLGDVATSEDSRAFARWYSNLVRFKSGQATIDVLFTDLTGQNRLGGDLLDRTFDEFRNRIGWGDPRILPAARAMATRLDSRPAHRLHLAGVAWSGLYDLRLAEAFSAGALAAATPRSRALRVWFAGFTGDARALREMLGSPRLEPLTRAEALERLEKLTRTEVASLRAEYRRLIDEAPEGWGVRAKYVDHLERTKRYAEARRVIQEWLDQPDAPDAPGLTWVVARTALARMYFHEERYEDAWSVIEGVVSSNQASAMERAALILDRLGRHADAEKIARAAVARYPDVPRTRATLAELYWHRGRHAEAADLLTKAPQPPTSTDWRRTIGPRFVEAFRGESPDKPLAALTALLTKRFNHFDLQQLAFAMADAKRYDVAFEMTRHFRWSGLGQIQFYVNAYGHLKAWRGRQVALDWLRQVVPPQILSGAVVLAYDHQHYDIVWDLMPDPAADSHSEFTWLMRAATSLRLPPTREQRQALLDYYRQPGGGYYKDTGRYLLGLISEGDLLRLAIAPKQRCEIPYYIGLRAEVEGRYADASDWYRVSVETGLINNGEYRWAHSTLARWQSAGKSLTRLAAEKL